MADDDMIQVVIHPALRPHLVRWLTERGLYLFPMPTNPDDLPTFGLGIETPPTTTEGDHR